MNPKKFVEKMSLNKELNITRDIDLSGTHDQISKICHDAIHCDGSTIFMLGTLTTQSYDAGNALQAFIVNRDGTVDNLFYCVIPEELVGSETNVHLVSLSVDSFAEEFQDSPFTNNPYILAYETKKGDYRFLPASKM